MIGQDDDEEEDLLATTPDTPLVDDTLVETNRAEDSIKKEGNKKPFHTMEEVIEMADEILTRVLESSQSVPFKNMDKLQGVVILTVVQVGLAMTPSLGSGIMLKREDNGWSNPAAVVLTGIGYGGFGISKKEIVMFINDKEIFERLAWSSGFRLGAQVEFTLGSFGRVFRLDGTVSRQTNLTSQSFLSPEISSITFFKGVFLGCSLEGAYLGARHATNEAFYGRPVSTREIVEVQDAAKIPADKSRILDQVHGKLNRIMEEAWIDEERSVKEARDEKVAKQIDAREESADLTCAKDHKTGYGSIEFIV